SDHFDQVVGTIRVDNTGVVNGIPLGLRGLSITTDNRYLVVAVPNEQHPESLPPSPPTPKSRPWGEIVFIDLDPNSKQFWRTRQKFNKEGPYQRLDADQLPLGVTASPDPTVVAFTNFGGSERRGVGLLHRQGDTWSVHYVDITLG